MSGAGRLNKDIYAKQSSKSGIAFHQGDVLYGKLRPYLQNWLLPTFDGLAVGDFWVLQPQNADSSFLYRLIQSRQFDEVANQSTGTKMPRADWKLVSKTVFSIPSYISEQAAIGTYFTALDNLITLHQCKCQIDGCRFQSPLAITWEQRKVSGIGNIVTGSTPKTSVSDNYGGEFLFVSPADIQENRYVDETITTLTKKGFDQGRKIREKASLFVSIGSTIGKVAQINQESTTNQQINAVEPYDNFDDDFIFTSLENISGSIKAIASNQAVPIVNKTTFGETEIQVPLELGEQQKIGQYFVNLDHLITLHQREFAFLCKEKSKKFRYIKNAWEQRKLGEIGSVSMCRRIFKEQTSENGEIPFYKIGTFGGEADAFISRELFEEYKAKYQYPKKGDILISASGSIGRTVVFTGKNEYFQDSNIVWLNHDKHLDNSFLKCFYSIVKWAGIEGSTIKRLYNDNILNTAITLPSVEEQQKIGAYFENLDNLITLHQRKPFLMKWRTSDANRSQTNRLVL